MKHIIYRFSLFLLLSPCFVSYAMEKEQPSSCFFFKQLLNGLTKLTTYYQEASASYMFYEQRSESGLPLLDIHVCNSMKLLMVLDKIYPNRPTIKLYKHLCNTQSEYNAYTSLMNNQSF